MEKTDSEIGISIIIPVYNVEKYLDQCLGSVCGQYEDWIQIICIDDCSEDCSLDILYKWKKTVPAIEIYHNSKNQGLAYTRNVGMAYAKGQYIMFLDSDDYIGNQVLKLLYENVKQNEVDVLAFSVEMFADRGYNKSFDKYLRIKKEPYKCQKGIEMIAEMVQRNEMFGTVWAAIYRKKYIVDKNVQFIYGTLYEDVPFFFKAMLEAEWARGITDVCYYYRQRDLSILHMRQYNRLLEGMFIGYIDMVRNWFVYNKCWSLEIKVQKSVNQYLAGIRSSIKKIYFYACYFGKEKLDPTWNQFVNSLLSRKAGKYCFSPGILRNEKIVIYGAGKRAKDAISLLQRYGAIIEKIVVSNKVENPESVMGIEVYEFEKDIVGDDSIIIIAVLEDDEIVRQLEENGICRYLKYEMRANPEFVVGGLYENSCSSPNEA